jgi:hypothetical protein
VCRIVERMKVIRPLDFLIGTGLSEPTNSLLAKIARMSLVTRKLMIPWSFHSLCFEIKGVGINKKSSVMR